MRDVLLNLTTSLDGYIADCDGGIGWLLPPPADVPADYLELMRRVDTLVMGRGTYETSLELEAEGGPKMFEGKDVYVFTSRQDLRKIRGVSFVGQPAEDFVAQLKQEPGGLIWLFGGGRLASALAEVDLIDEYLIVVQPILLGRGKPLWHPHPRPQRLTASPPRLWPGGLVELRYRRA